jgi:HlyD family secretion protein
LRQGLLPTFRDRGNARTGGEPSPFGEPLAGKLLVAKSGEIATGAPASPIHNRRADEVPSMAAAQSLEKAGNPAPAGRAKRLLLVLAAITAVASAGIAFSQASLLRRSRGNTIRLSGNIEAHESVLSFKSVQSRIVELPFDEGQWVEAGTPLARVDDLDYRQQVVVSQAALRVHEEQAAAALQRLEAARKTVLRDEADVEQREIDYRRATALWENRVISANEHDLAATALRESGAGHLRDQALEAAAEKDVTVAEASVRSAQENVKLAQIILGYTRLYAPFSGVILVRNAEVGEQVQPGTPVFTLADLDHVWLRAYVNETDVGRIRWGQSATISTDSYPGRTYAGRISMISSNAEFTPKSVETHAERVTLVYRIRIDIDNPSHELKPGMPADATLDARPAGAS